MKVLVFFSGGKDSQASLIWAVEKYGVKNCEAVFMDTVWEHPLTYIHVAEVVSQLKVKFTTLKSAKYPGFIDISVNRKRFPSSKARFCTQVLKIYPSIDYILSHNEHLLTIEGIRSDESNSRSLMDQECSYFKYYFQPYQTNSLIISNLSSKPNLSLNQADQLKKATLRLSKGFEDTLFLRYRKKEIIKWSKIYNCDKYRPFFYETAFDVIDYIINHDQKPNPLYYMGFKRVGCFTCIMSSLAELKLIIFNFPDMWYRLKEAEKIVGSSFFAPGDIPLKNCANGIFPTASDVEKYIKENNATLDLFSTDTPSCMSVYNLCN